MGRVRRWPHVLARRCRHLLHQSEHSAIQSANGRFFFDDHFLYFNECRDRPCIPALVWFPLQPAAATWCKRRTGFPAGPGGLLCTAEGKHAEFATVEPEYPT